MFQGLWFFCKFSWKIDKRYVIYNVLYQLINSLIPLANIVLPKFIIDGLTTGQPIQRIAFWVLLLIGYNLAANCISTWLMMTAFTLRCKVAMNFDHVMHQKLADADFENLESPAFLDKKEKANKFLYGDWHGFAYVFDSALMVIGQFITLAGIIAIVATLNVGMVLLFIALVLLSSLVEGWAKKNDMRLSLEQTSIERGLSYFSGLFESFSYGKEIRMNSLGDWLLDQEDRYAQQTVSYYRRRNNFYIKSGAFAALLAFIQQGAAYAYLVVQVTQRAISIGSFSMYVGAVTSFANAMKTVINSFIDVKAYGVYYNAVRDYMRVPDTIRTSGSKKATAQTHVIEFRNVSFRYAGQSHYALKNINIQLKTGDTLSIVGENGAGKTTFIKLLTRLYDPTEGEILLDGMNIKEYDYDIYTALFSTVFQDYKLFSFTLKENVCLAQDARDDEIEAILRQVGLGERLSTLPHGIHTMVYKNFDEEGFEPSGGEGQKIALARALFKNAPIVILDEPTAALDPKAEFELHQKFQELVKGKTAVYISHRMSSAKFCKKIAVFEQGQITEYGTHEALMQKEGTYAKLFEMQSQFYVE